MTLLLKRSDAAAVATGIRGTVGLLLACGYEEAITRFEVRRLAALDMYGAGGAMRRRQIIRAEFIAGAIGGVLFGALALLSGGGAYRLLGAWLIGVGINYVPLAAHAVSLFAPGGLEAELADLDIRAEQRYYTRAQALLCVPLLIALLAAAQRSRQQRR